MELTIFEKTWTLIFDTNTLNIVIETNNIPNSVRKNIKKSNRVNDF